MKYFIYNCLFLLIVLFFSYYNTLNHVENFTPKIREMYRPYVRSIRVTSENFYNKHSTNAYNFFKKFELI
jgi:hypothetical protein